VRGGVEQDGILVPEERTAPRLPAPVKNAGRPATLSGYVSTLGVLGATLGELRD